MDQHTRIRYSSHICKTTIIKSDGDAPSGVINLMFDLCACEEQRHMRTDSPEPVLLADTISSKISCTNVFKS